MLVISYSPGSLLRFSSPAFCIQGFFLDLTPSGAFLRCFSEFFEFMKYRDLSSAFTKENGSGNTKFSNLQKHYTFI